VSFSIRWNRRSMDAIAEIWLANPDQRSDITQASSSLDQLLSFNPEEQGESREYNLRVIFVPPLVVTFDVDNVNQVVRIMKVRHLRCR
jgi:hypothetical protein